jgi:hypothetical protein
LAAYSFGRWNHCHPFGVIGVERGGGCYRAVTSCFGTVNPLSSLCNGLGV